MAKQVKLIAQAMTEEEQAKARDEQRALAAAEAEAAANRMEMLRKTYTFDIKSARQTKMADAYDATCSGALEIGLEQAVATIAAHFYDPAMIWDRSEGRTVQGNAMAYTQKDVLNGLCFTLAGRLGRVEDGIDTARAKAKRAVETSDGTEISLVEIDRQLDWVERLENQHAAVTELLRAFEVAHLIATGIKFVMPAPQHKAALPSAKAADNDVAAANRAARLAKLGVSAPAPQMNTDGTLSTVQ